MRNSQRRQLTDPHAEEPRESAASRSMLQLSTPAARWNVLRGRFGAPQDEETWKLRPPAVPRMNQPRQERRGRRSSRSRRARRRAPSAPCLLRSSATSAPKRKCSSAYREGRLAHAWLIGGQGGNRQGDARLAVRPLRARQPRSGGEGGPRGAQPPCRADASGGAASRGARPSRFCPDPPRVAGATKRLASEIAVEAVRHGLQVFQLSAAFGGWRIAIVDSAEDLNRNSANALLKMVEEPPQRSLILIVSHRPGQILPTIRSRCRQFAARSS